MLRRLLTMCLTVGAVLAAQEVGRPAAASGQTREDTASPIPRHAEADFRVISWNVSVSNFFQHSEGFRAVFRMADPDVLILDEVEGGRTAAEVAAVLRGIRSESDTLWNVVVGEAGGYQRGAIASRHPIAPVPELRRLSYPEPDLARLRAMMDEETWRRARPNLDAGIPVAAGIVHLGPRTILCVAIDLQSGGNTPGWEEARRVIEVREIRAAITRFLAREGVDAILLAGDLNLVTSGIPLALLTNPYPAPHFALVPAEANHLDGVESWTWDGRGTEFPSRALDYSLYSPVTLQPLRGTVLSTDDLTERQLATWALTRETSFTLSDHLPIVVDYRWRTAPPR